MEQVVRFQCPLCKEYKISGKGTTARVSSSCVGWRVYQFVNLSIFWWVLWGGSCLERVFCGGCLIRRDVREEREWMWKMRRIGGVGTVGIR